MRLFRAQEGLGPVIVFFSPGERHRWVQTAPDRRHVVRWKDKPRSASRRPFSGAITSGRIHPTRQAR